MLTIDAVDPFGKIPEFKFCAVRIERERGLGVAQRGIGRHHGEPGKAGHDGQSRNGRHGRKTSEAPDRRDPSAGGHELGAAGLYGQHSRAVAQRVPATEPHGERDQCRRECAQQPDQHDVEGNRAMARSERTRQGDDGRADPCRHQSDLHPRRADQQCHVGRDRRRHGSDLFARTGQRQQQRPATGDDDGCGRDGPGSPSGELARDLEFAEAEVQRAQRDDQQQSHRTNPRHQRPRRGCQARVGGGHQRDRSAAG